MLACIRSQTHSTCYRQDEEERGLFEIQDSTNITRPPYPYSRPLLKSSHKLKWLSGEPDYETKVLKERNNSHRRKEAKAVGLHRLAVLVLCPSRCLAFILFHARAFLYSVHHRTTNHGTPPHTLPKPPSPVEPCRALQPASPQHATACCHQPCAAKDMLLALLCRWLIADSALVVKSASSSTEASAGPVRQVTGEQPNHKAGCGQSCLKVNRLLQPYLYVPIFALVAPRFSRGRG